MTPEKLEKIRYSLAATDSQTARQGWAPTYGAWEMAEDLLAYVDALRAEVERKDAALRKAEDAFEHIETLTDPLDRKPGNLLLRIRDTAAAALAPDGFIRAAISPSPGEPGKGA